MITSQLLRSIMPAAGDRADLYAPPLDAACREFDINTAERLAAFLATIAHESGSLRYVRELASGQAYEGRPDLGNTNIGDGPRFKGRGLIQITGRANYAQAGAALGLELSRNPELLESPSMAARSAAWWWSAHGCNDLANDFKAVTKRVNGGLNGWEDRLAFYERAKKVLETEKRSTDMPQKPEIVDISVPANPADIQEVIKENTPMGPFIIPALSAIMGAVPDLIRLFGSKDNPVVERNAKAAEAVVQIAQQATGAANAQEAAEKIQNDPACAQAVRDAIKAQWFELIEVGGGVQEARKANSDPTQLSFWKQPAFYVTLLLMPLVYGVVYAVVFRGGFSDDVRAMVVSAVVTGVLSGIMGFWLGSSFGSARKTEMLKG